MWGNRFVMRSALAAATAAVLAVAGVVTAPQAAAVGSAVRQSSIPTAVPSAKTPNITDSDGTVYAITKVGDQIIVGGSFANVADHASSTTLNRPDIFAFDASTGAVSTTFAPALDGTVEALLPGPTANTVYVGGYFNYVNGTRSKGVTLLDTQTGAIVNNFKPPALNGAVFTLARAAGHLLVGGSFTSANAAVRGGLASLGESTGALDNYLTVQLAGHHNWNGSGAKGPVGGRAMAVSPDASRLVVLGNFKTADGLPRDQIAMIDLTSTGSSVDPNWATQQYTARCASGAFDTYVTDVQYAPDGSYFVVTATGGSTFSTNSDGSRSLCDSASRWKSDASGSNVQPVWVDYTGNDTLWSVALTGTAVYLGGHQRWLNNSAGNDSPGEGSVPRPGMAALDPDSGVPLAWNPGRNPRGAGAYALLVTDDGLYVGSDTDWIGNFQYKRQKLAWFPLAGGTAPASTAVAALPSNVYLAGPTGGQSGTTSNDLAYRPMSKTQVGSLTTVPSTGISWGSTRGAFEVGGAIFYGSTDGNFYRADFDGTHVGTPTVVDPYDDPYWSSIDTGSGGWKYQGVKSSYYGEISSLTGAFYANGKLYYTRQNQSTLYWRWFSPDSGIIGSQEFTIAGSVFSHVAGIVASAGTLYYADSRDGSLHSMSFAAGTPDPSTDQTVSTLDWRARSLFLYGAPDFPNTPPTASATVNCTQLSCAFDGTASSDPDGSIESYAWDFGDGTTGTGAAPTHAYAQAGTYTVKLVVTDDRGADSQPWTGQAKPTAPSYAVSWVGADSTNTISATPSVTVPAGTQYGDTEIAYVTTANAGSVTSPPNGGGWRQIAKETISPLETTVFARTAPAGDAGTTISVPLATSDQADVELAVYRNADIGDAKTRSDVKTQTHDTPAVTVSDAGSWVVSYWSVRSSSTTAWTAPNALTVRAESPGSGGGHVDVLFGDSDGAVPSGSYGPLTADAGSLNFKADSAAIVLTPAAPPAPNAAPTASATDHCTDLACSFDGTGSSDADGTVDSYAWDFGDGTHGSGATPSHGYAQSGTYTVSLVVTDDRGASSDPWTGQVTVSGSAQPVSFVDAASSNVSSAAPTVDVPNGVQAGDTEVLFVSTAHTGSVAGTPQGTGWQQLAVQTTSPLQTTVFTRVAPSGDAGTQVTMPLTQQDQVDLELAVYRGAAPGRIATAGDVQSTKHTAPAVAVDTAGSWVVSYWAVRWSSATTWHAPAAVTVRAQSAGSGGGHVDVLLGDSGGPVATGTYGALTATTDSVKYKADEVSLVLAPAA